MVGNFTRQKHLKSICFQVPSLVSLHGGEMEFGLEKEIFVSGLFLKQQYFADVC